MKLYEYTAQYRTALIDLNDMDLPIEVLNDTMEALQGEISVKGKDVAFYIRNLEADTVAIKSAEDAMKKRRLAIENRIAWTKRYLLYNMQQSDITEISCPYFVIKTKKNPPKVVISDSAKLPDKYIKKTVVETIDKTLIKTDIKDGAIIPGAILSQEWRLDIK